MKRALYSIGAALVLFILVGVGVVLMNWLDGFLAGRVLKLLSLAFVFSWVCLGFWKELGEKNGEQP